MTKDSNLAPYYFHQGTNFRTYDYLGCNVSKSKGKYIYTFRTWAPNATSVGLISDFSDWNSELPLTRITNNGVWELVYTSDISLHKKAYKFKITANGKSVNKGDPYARFSRGLDDGASLIFTSSFKWSDGAWIRQRKRSVRGDTQALSIPINIYEMHAGSFMRHDDGSPLSYRELADIIPAYVKAMGYTHIELLPIMEHPYDGSWGYQVCGFYAPTSRYGDPDDFRYFVNALHTAGIGVILDWVPAHFPKDEWGLYEYDGTPLYEYQGRDRQESASWGTRFFDLGREEVQCFLISNALYYLREFHIDGLRVDAVASMLYLDYDRAPGEWIPNAEGGNVSFEALAFLKKLNTAVYSEFPYAMMIAEESGDYGRLTLPQEKGGVGFTLKWNMGWANDFYDYLLTDPVFRKHKHRALNFPIMYAFSENYCLPISHDEVVHGKLSLINKMHGEYEDKFKQMRIALMLMMTYPGKKMTFMGTEYAQFREWNYADSLEWFMLDYPLHSQMRDYTRALNHFYLGSKELWEIDFDPAGFAWILPDEAEKCSIAFKRISSDKSSLTVLINFSGADQTLRIPAEGADLSVVFASDPGIYEESYPIVGTESNQYADITLARFSGLILKENSGTKEFKI